MARKSKVLFRNRSYTGWWIVGEVEYFVSRRQKKLTPNSRCIVWENTRLIQAKDREEAYRKAVKLGRRCRPNKTDKGEFRFLGISMLLPVYEEIEDGAEIRWDDRGDMTMERARRLVKPKKKLPVFDDRD